MGRTTVLQEVRIMRFEDVYGRFRVGRLGCEDAADFLGVSVSTFRRYRRRYEEEGVAGLYDRRPPDHSGRRQSLDDSRSARSSTG